MATSTFTGNTGNAGNKNIEYNISTEKLLVPSHGGGVYVPQQPSEVSFCIISHEIISICFLD